MKVSTALRASWRCKHCTRSTWFSIHRQVMFEQFGALEEPNPRAEEYARSTGGGDYSRHYLSLMRTFSRTPRNGLWTKWP